MFWGKEMHKLKRTIWSLLLAAGLLAALAAPAGQPLAFAAEKEVYLGGMPAGFTLGMDGAQIVGFCEVLTKEGTRSPAKEAGLEAGDLILSLGGVRVRSAADIDAALAAVGGGREEVVVRRKGERVSASVQPACDAASGRGKLGVLVRDSVSGIGTVTYIETGSLRFGSLGHAVAGEDGKSMDLGRGDIFRCSIVDVVRGERGRAGELKGVFLNDRKVAVADKNCEQGIYGYFDRSYDLTALRRAAVGAQARPGAATLYTTVDGVAPREYAIDIVKVDEGSRSNRNFVLKVTDGALLADTGGIVQGMSGSPILQDGKLIGAVTHVFLNDPTRGYGIAIGNMLGN